MNFLRNNQAQVYAIGRIVFGFLFMLHGIGKLQAGEPPEYMMPAAWWIATLVETIGGAMIMIGLFGEVAALLCSGLMAVAYFWMHNSFSGLEGMNPLANKGELAVLYCFAFLFISANGSGIWSVDAKRG